MKNKHCIALLAALLVCGSAVAATQLEEGESRSGAKYLLAMPDDWNGDLVVYAHGFIDTAESIALPTLNDIEPFPTFVKLEEKMLEFRVGQLDEDERKQFNQLEAQLEFEARKKLDDWAKTKPDRPEENMETYKAMSSEIAEVENKISRY